MASSSSTDPGIIGDHRSSGGIIEYFQNWFCCSAQICKAPGSAQAAHVQAFPATVGHASTTTCCNLNPCEGSSQWDQLPPSEKMKMQDKLSDIVEEFALELARGKVFMKLGRNGRLFYRWCTLDAKRETFSMHIKGQIVEYPFTNIQHVRFGYDMSDFFQIPLSLPSESLGAVIILNDNRRLNLVFSNPMERDEFVTCMLVLKEKVAKGAPLPYSSSRMPSTPTSQIGKACYKDST